MLGGLLLSFCKPSGSLGVRAVPAPGREGGSALQPIPRSASGGGESPHPSAALPQGKALLASRSCPAAPRGICKLSHAVLLLSADLPFVSNHQAGF